MLRVLVVDAHTLVRKGFREVLRGLGPFELGEASNAAEAAERLAAGRWDVVIVDNTLPEADYLGVLAQLRQQEPAPPALVLGGDGSAAHVYQAIRQGAAGYISKVASTEELQQALRTVLAGRHYVAPPPQHEDPASDNLESRDGGDGSDGDGDGRGKGDYL